MPRKKLYQILLTPGGWTNLKLGREVGDGSLEYVRRNGVQGIAQPDEWRPHPVVLSQFKFTPAPPPSRWKRLRTKIVKLLIG